MGLSIAVPTRGRPHFGTVAQLEKITRSAGLPSAKYFPSHLSSADGRNQIVKWVMEETADDILMCDDDVVPPDDILQLAYHGKDIVAAPVMIMQPQVNLPFFNIYRKEGDGYMPLDMQYGLIGLRPCDAAGTGAIFISRRVLHALKPVFDFVTDEWGVMTRSEDLSFCEKAVRAGFKIYADFDRPCEHMATVGLLAHHYKLVNAVNKMMQRSA